MTEKAQREYQKNPQKDAERDPQKGDPRGFRQRQRCSTSSPAETKVLRELSARDKGAACLGMSAG